MRLDVYEKVRIYQMDDTKPNYAEIARRHNCDPRTVKRYYNGEGKPERKNTKKPSKLDSYKDIIETKLDLGVSAMGIYLFIRKKGYEGKYTILREYAKNHKNEKVKKATIRFESNPGLSAQVDWKENFSLHTKQGKKITFQIFLMVLGYSRSKYLSVTFSKDQKVLFNCLANGFNYFGGSPKEIWFDNMKTVVDQAKSQFEGVIFNQSFYYFSKDMGFTPIACRPYRPQTKGKVEALARLTNRLKAYDYEIEDIKDIYELVETFMEEINNEVSQATGYPPNVLLIKEKEYFNPLPPQEIIQGYQSNTITRKVSLESMITYGGIKYSVPTKYIGKHVNLDIDNDIIHIYYSQKLIRKHKISEKPFNYEINDAKEILLSDVFKTKSDQEITDYIKENLNAYDEL